MTKAYEGFTFCPVKGGCVRRTCYIRGWHKGWLLCVWEKNSPLPPSTLDSRPISEHAFVSYTRLHCTCCIGKNLCPGVFAPAPLHPSKVKKWTLAQTASRTGYSRRRSSVAHPARWNEAVIFAAKTNIPAYQIRRRSLQSVLNVGAPIFSSHPRRKLPLKNSEEVDWSAEPLGKMVPIRVVNVGVIQTFKQTGVCRLANIHTHNASSVLAVRRALHWCLIFCLPAVQRWAELPAKLMKSPVREASTAAVAATTWAENLGGRAGDHARPGRQTCRAFWREDLAAFEVLQPRGDSLRSMVRIRTCL